MKLVPWTYRFGHLLSQRTTFAFSPVSLSRRTRIATVTIASVGLLSLVWTWNRHYKLTSTLGTSSGSYFSTKQPSPTINMQDLPTFLKESKERYLTDVIAGKGHDWTVVMGNEAGGG
jgi:hypothetical protein